jgi:hypothetical protein
MRERAPNGRKLGQGWGNGEDLLARPTVKAMRIVRELQHGRAQIAVLTDTRLEGEEARAMRAHLLKWHGLASEVTDMTPGEGAGGVMIVWDSTAMMRAGTWRGLALSRMTFRMAACSASVFVSFLPNPARVVAASRIVALMKSLRSWVSWFFSVL